MVQDRERGAQRQRQPPCIFKESLQIVQMVDGFVMSEEEIYNNLGKGKKTNKNFHIRKQKSKKLLQL